MNAEHEATEVAARGAQPPEGVVLGWRDVVELGLDPEPDLMSDRDDR